jgi:hypothetical protein
MCVYIYVYFHLLPFNKYVNKNAKQLVWSDLWKATFDNTRDG